jgi:hypothetical protein
MNQYKIPPYYVLEIGDIDVSIRSFSKRHKGGKLSQVMNNRGYFCVKINGEAIRVHVIVSKCVLGQTPIGYEINHKDGCKTNNHPDNLEHVTHLENIRHAVGLGLFGKRKLNKSKTK